MIRNSLSFLLLVAAFSIPGFVNAQESLGQFEAKLTKTPAAEDKPETHKLEYSGTYPDVPQGTCINVRFRLQGNQQHIAVYRAYTTTDGKFAGNSGDFSKKMIDGVYEAEFLFSMGRQKKEVRKWFRLNMGWARSHTEILKVELITVGDPTKKKEVEKKLFEKMEDFRTRAETAYRVLEGRITNNQTPEADWSEKGYTDLYSKLEKIQAEFYQWQGSYVALPAGKIRNRLFGTINTLFTVLDEYTNKVDAAILKQHVTNLTTAFSELKTALELKPIEIKDPKAGK